MVPVFGNYHGIIGFVFQRSDLVRKSGKMFVSTIFTAQKKKEYELMYKIAHAVPVLVFGLPNKPGFGLALPKECQGPCIRKKLIAQTNEGNIHQHEVAAIDTEKEKNSCA